MQSKIDKILEEFEYKFPFWKQSQFFTQEPISEEFYNVKDFFSQKLTEVYQEGQNEATSQYKKDMQDTYEKGKEEAIQDYKQELIKFLKEISGDSPYFCTWEGDIHPFTKQIEGYNKLRDDLITKLKNK